MTWPVSYEQLQRDLRAFTNIDGEPVPYDFGGAAGLLAAVLDNLRVNATDADLGDLAGYLSPDQSAFLLGLAARLEQSSPE